MSDKKDGPHTHVEVDDPVKAFDRLKALGRKVLAVPKNDVDAAMKKKKSKHRSGAGR